MGPHPTQTISIYQWVEFFKSLLCTTSLVYLSRLSWVGGI